LFNFIIIVQLKCSVSTHDNQINEQDNDVDQEQYNEQDLKQDYEQTLKHDQTYEPECEHDLEQDSDQDLEQDSDQDLKKDNEVEYNKDLTKNEQEFELKRAQEAKDIHEELKQKEDDDNEPEQLLIAFLGNKYVGKSSGGNYLVTKYDFVEDYFAYLLKKSAKLLFNLTDKQLYGTKQDKETIDTRYEMSSRQILQKFGEMMKKEFGENFWINSFKTRYERNYNDDVVVTDCRYKNEVNAIKDLEGYVIKINRDTDDGSKADTHVSETEINEIFNYDYLIENNGTLEEFYGKLDEVYKNIKEHKQNKDQDNSTAVSPSES
jgi:hypothetical protein